MVFATLLLLTVEPGKRTGRVELLGMLWPGIPASRAGHCLRQTIYRLRTLGVPLEVNRGHLRVPPESVDCDADALLRARRADDIEHLADSVDGAFLPGYSPAFSEPLREWVDRYRDLVTASARRVLAGSIATRKARGEWADVERLAHRCLVVDPLNEDATLALAEAAALHGGKAEAMGILDRYLREMGPTARELRLPAMTLRRRIAEPDPEFPLAPPLQVPFVGRSAEMAALAAALRSARSGTESVHFIHGEPGIGKTRLLTEFSRAASLEGARIASTLCQSSDVRRPLSAFVDLVPKLMTMPGALGCSPQSHKYLRRLIEHHSSDEPPTPDTAEAKLLHANVRSSIFDLFDAIASEVPLLITVEDVHWLDPVSWEIVLEAAAWVGSRQVIMIFTARGRELAAATTDSQAGSGIRTHYLGPIDHDALRQLFDENLRGSKRAVTRAFRDWCVEMSGGNPYYLSELALHGLDGCGGFEVPPSLTTLVADRVARLQPTSRRVLQACAVLAKNATLERVEAMLGQPRTRLLDALDELEQTRLLALRDGRLVCQHGLLMEAALDRTSKAALSYLHRKAATTLTVALQKDCEVSLAWDSAKHLVSAGERSQAAAVLVDCARHALELGRPLEANEILVGALEFPLSATERVSVLGERAHALRAADQWDDAVTVLTEIGASKSHGSRLEHNDHELQLISAKWVAGHDPNLLLSSLRDCCHQRASTSGHRLSAARFGFMIADNICEAEVAHDMYNLVAADVCSPTSPKFDRVYCHMIYHVAFGNILEAEGAALEIDAALAERSDVREACLARTHIAEVLKEAGRLKESTTLLQRAFHEAVTNSLLWLACLAARRLAWQCLDSADYDGAAQWIEVALPISDRIQHLASRADTLGAAAELALHNGDTRLAAELLTQSAAAWKDRQHIRSQAFWLSSQCGVWLTQGDRGACMNARPRFMDLYQIVRRHCDQDQTTARLVRLLDFTDEPDSAERVLHEYLWTFRRGRAPLSAELDAIRERRSLDVPAFMTRTEGAVRLPLRGGSVS